MAPRWFSVRAAQAVRMGIVFIATLLTVDHSSPRALRIESAVSMVALFIFTVERRSNRSIESEIPPVIT